MNSDIHLNMSESTYYLISQFYVTFAIKVDNICNLFLFLRYGVI